MTLYYWEYIEISQWNVCWREREKRRNEFVFSKTLRFVPLHLTWYLELRESCWELCDSQRLWESWFSEVFAGVWVVFFETTACLWGNDVSLWKSDVLFVQFCRTFFRFLPLEFLFLPLGFWKSPTKSWNCRTKLSENAQSLKWTSRKRQNGDGKSVFWFPRMKKNLAIFAVWY